MNENTASAKAEEQEDARGRKRRRGSSGKQSNLKPSFNMSELRELAELVNEHGFTDFEFENENIRVRLSKMTAPPVFQAVQPAAAVVPQAGAAPAAAGSAAPAEGATIEAAVETEDSLYKITSPIVGTFYRSPAPDKAAYVEEGDRVKEDSVVCIVEAMKLMNEIQAGVAGEVVKIYVENGQPVEYGQPLFGIRQ